MTANDYSATDAATTTFENLELNPGMAEEERGTCYSVAADDLSDSFIVSQSETFPDASKQELARATRGRLKKPDLVSETSSAVQTLLQLERSPDRIEHSGSLAQTLIDSETQTLLHSRQVGGDQTMFKFLPSSSKNIQYIIIQHNPNNVVTLPGYINAVPGNTQDHTALNGSKASHGATQDGPAGVASSDLERGILQGGSGPEGNDSSQRASFQEVETELDKNEGVTVHLQERSVLVKQELHSALERRKSCVQNEGYGPSLDSSSPQVLSLSLPGRAALQGEHVGSSSEQDVEEAQIHVTMATTSTSLPTSVSVTDATSRPANYVPGTRVVYRTPGASYLNRSGKVKRPMNAFMVWARTFRAELAKRMPNATNSEISVRLGQVWNEMTPDQKQPFFAEAERIKHNHKQEFPGWVYRPTQAKRRDELLTHSVMWARFGGSSSSAATLAKMASVASSNVIKVQPQTLLPGLAATTHANEPPPTPASTRETLVEKPKGPNSRQNQQPTEASETSPTTILVSPACRSSVATVAPRPASSSAPPCGQPQARPQDGSPPRAPSTAQTHSTMTARHFIVSHETLTAPQTPTVRQSLLTQQQPRPSRPSLAAQQRPPSQGSQQFEAAQSSLASQKPAPIHRAEEPQQGFAVVKDGCGTETFDVRKSSAAQTIPAPGRTVPAKAVSLSKTAQIRTLPATSVCLPTLNSQTCVLAKANPVTRTISLAPRAVITPNSCQARSSSASEVVVVQRDFREKPVLCRTDSASMRSDPAPIRVDPAPIRVDPALIRVDPALIRVDPAPIRVDPAPTRVDSAHVRQDSAPSRSGSAPIHCISLHPTQRAFQMGQNCGNPTVYSTIWGEELVTDQRDTVKSRKSRDRPQTTKFVVAVEEIVKATKRTDSMRKENKSPYHANCCPSDLQCPSSVKKVRVDVRQADNHRQPAISRVRASGEQGCRVQRRLQTVPERPTVPSCLEDSDEDCWLPPMVFSQEGPFQTFYVNEFPHDGLLFRGLNDISPELREEDELQLIDLDNIEPPLKGVESVNVNRSRDKDGGSRRNNNAGYVWDHDSWGKMDSHERKKNIVSSSTADFLGVYRQRLEKLSPTLQLLVKIQTAHALHQAEMLQSPRFFRAGGSR